MANPNVKRDAGRGRKPIAIVNTNMLHHLTSGKSLFIHRQKFSSLTIVGITEDLTDAERKIEFRMRDGEGPPVKFLKWKADQCQRTEDGSMVRNGALVRVYGNICREPESPEPLVVAFKIIPITDLNELTMHHIEVVASSVILSKVKNNVLAGLPSHSGFPGSTVQSQDKREDEPQQQDEDPSDAPGMKLSHIMIMKAISACKDPKGITRDKLFKSLSEIDPAKHSLIVTALEFLCNEGHVYNTIDDDHYQVAG